VSAEPQGQRGHHEQVDQGRREQAAEDHDGHRVLDLVARNVAENDQALTAPALEGGIAVLGSLAIGVPVGIGLSVVAVRVLGLFFTLPPPLVVLPRGALVSLAAFMIAMSAVALGVALRRVARQDAAPVLREP
jgi:hypothetical protein